MQFTVLENGSIIWAKHFRPPSNGFR